MHAIFIRDCGQVSLLVPIISCIHASHTYVNVSIQSAHARCRLRTGCGECLRSDCMEWLWQEAGLVGLQRCRWMNCYVCVICIHIHTYIYIHIYCASPDSVYDGWFSRRLGLFVCSNDGEKSCYCNTFSSIRHYHDTRFYVNSKLEVENRV